MKRLCIILCCLLGIYTSQAQPSVDIMEFIQNAPWNTAPNEINAMYQEFKVEPTDSITKHLPMPVTPIISDNLFYGFKLGKYDGFMTYVSADDSDHNPSPAMFMTILNSSQLADTDIDRFTQYADSIYRANLGDPSLLQNNIKQDNVNIKAMHFWLKQSVTITSVIGNIENESDTTLICMITAMNADDGNNDFRESRWGDSMEQVMQKEGFQNQMLSDFGNNIYMFSTELNGKSCEVFYYFTDNNELYSTSYIFGNIPADSCITEYNRLSSLLTEKYGKPKLQNHTWSDPSYELTRPKDGNAVSSGDLKFLQYRQNKRSIIKSELSGYDGSINIVINYTSLQHMQKKAIKMLQN